MKVVIVSTYEKSGGAAIAANRLMNALNKSGLQTTMLVRDKQTTSENVYATNINRYNRAINFFRFLFERLIIFIHNGFNKKTLFEVSIANTGTDISHNALIQQADVIHLHWTNQGFLSIKDINKLIQTGKPIIWTMHDMFSFTGICHYAGDCKQYESGCLDCPLNDGKLKSLTKKVFSSKQRIYSKNIVFVGCSNWIAKCAGNSLLLKDSKVVSIPNPIDNELFRLIDKGKSKDYFHLSKEKYHVLFTSVKFTDKRKGGQFIPLLSKILEENHPSLAEKIEFIILGNQIDESLLNNQTKAIPLGYIGNADELSMAYSAADLFITLSLEDNLPNVIMESMACGTPVVGFNVGGIPEMIDHKVNGYVADYLSIDDIAKGIVYILDAPEEEKNKFAQRCIDKVMENYSEKCVSEQYIDLYKKVIKG